MLHDHDAFTRHLTLSTVPRYTLGQTMLLTFACLPLVVAWAPVLALSAAGSILARTVSAGLRRRA